MRMPEQRHKNKVIGMQILKRGYKIFLQPRYKECRACQPMKLQLFTVNSHWLQSMQNMETLKLSLVGKILADTCARISCALCYKSTIQTKSIALCDLDLQTDNTQETESFNWHEWIPEQLPEEHWNRIIGMGIRTWNRIIGMGIRTLEQDHWNGNKNTGIRSLEWE